MGKPKHTCLLPECESSSYANSYCERHKRYVEKYGKPYRPCVDCGCDLPAGLSYRVSRCELCRVCNFPGCDSPKRRYGYCNSHSGRVYRNGNAQRNCPTCGEALSLESSGGKRYCSEKCRVLPCEVEGCENARVAKKMCTKHYKRVYEFGVTLLPQCQGCGKSMPAETVGGTKYCSDACRPRCEAPGCGDAQRAIGYCLRHANRVIYHGGLPTLNFHCSLCGVLVERSYTDRQQRSNKSCCEKCRTRISRQHGAYKTKVVRGGEAECGICGEGIDLALQYPDPACLSIDHVVPLSLGGTNNERNLQPAHLGCNTSKRNKLTPIEKGVLVLF